MTSSNYIKNCTPPAKDCNPKPNDKPSKDCNPFSKWNCWNDKPNNDHYSNKDCHPFKHWGCCSSSTEVLVGFSNDGQDTDYIAGNEFLAEFFGVATIKEPTVVDDITNGVEASYSVPDTEFPATPNGTTTATYSSAGGKKTYNFASDIWDGVKNISVIAETCKKISFTTDNFVQADMDFSKAEKADLTLLDLKRSHIVTGDGNDTIDITTASNNTTWINFHFIDTGKGDDKVTFDLGDAGLLGTSIVTVIDGSLTGSNVWLGKGDDTFLSKDGVKIADNVWGEEGNDKISTSGGDDFLYGGEGKDELYGGAGVDTIDGGNGKDTINGGADQDTLTGGNGKDTFEFSTADEDFVTDFNVANDTLDISDLIDIAVGPDVLGNINDYVSISLDGGDTLLSFDADGTGAGVAEIVARLQGIDLTAAHTVNSLIAANALEVA